MSYFNRADFPLLQKKHNGKSLVYFDNAATTQKPIAVIDAITHFYMHSYATVGRGMYPLAEEATKKCNQVREQVATFINAACESEIVFTSGATDAINMVAHSWALHAFSPGDEIVLSELEHHANILPWQYVAQKTGAVLRFIPVKKTGDLAYETLEQVVTKRTKLVAVMHTSNALGNPIDLSKIVVYAKRVGAKVLVDASQAMIHAHIDVQAVACDFLVFSGHKMFGPTGIGVLYVKQDIHDLLVPFRTGGGMLFSASYQKATWAKMPHILEAGTPPIAQIIGLGAAINYCNKNIAWKELCAYESRITSYAIDCLQAIDEVNLLGPIALLRQKGHQISFVVKNIHSHDIASFLGSYGVCVRAGHHCAQPLAQKLGYESSIRASFAGYNTLQEVDILVKSLQKVISMFL